MKIAPSTSGNVPLSRNRDFALLWTGQALSSLGSQTGGIAYPLLALALTHSPAKAGVVAFALSLPYTLFVLPAGVIADRVDRKRLMLASDVGRALAVASLVVAHAFGHLTFAQLAIVAFVEGTFRPFFNIAQFGAIRQVVPPPQIPEAIARDESRMFGAMVAGPPLGGVLYGVGRILPFLVDALSYAFSLASLLAMRTPFQEARVEPRGRLREELQAGARFLWAQPFLRTCALMFAVSNVAASALFFLVIVVAREQGLSSATIGVLLAASGVVGLAGSFAAPPLQRRLPVRLAVIVPQWTAIALVPFLVQPNAYLLFAAALPFTFLSPLLNSVVIGYRTAITPPALQGRVNSAARFVAMLVSPLGPLAAGALLEATSARATVVVVTVWLLTVAAATSLSGSIRAAPSLAALQPD
ncbi:MAG TPA: MFS transporter [Gaiellaceae bacterium]